MAKKLISEVLTEASKITKKADRMEYLRKNSSPALRDVLRIAFDDDIISVLPSGAPTYNKDDAPIPYKGAAAFLIIHDHPKGVVCTSLECSVIVDVFD